MGIRILGTGSFLPPQEVGNELVLRHLDKRKPDGAPITTEWLDRHFGIKTRRVGCYDFDAGRQLSAEEGGLYDNDLAEQAVRLALKDASITVGEVDSLVHVSCTPDFDTRCAQPLGHLARRLGVRSNCDLDHQNLGCAGLAKGIRNAAASIKAGMAEIVVVVASNTTSAQLVRDRYITDRPGFEWAWLSPAVFADGAAAVVLSNSAPEGHGLLAVCCETHPEIELVRYPGGGGRAPTSRENVDDHVYIMNTTAVNEAFRTLMPRNVELMRAQTGLELADFVRVYIHQANGPAVRMFAELAGIPSEKVPINIDRYGNTSAASTLILFDEDRQAGILNPGDRFLFLWIGAGAGAMNGFAAFQL